jgi:hypothetical protein
VPNILLQQNNIESIIGNDLRLTYADGLDWIVTQDSRPPERKRWRATRC